MKVAILAGGKGSRLVEETQPVSKPMISIGDKPILWHIMMIYSHYGYNEFVIALGHKGESIRRFFGECGTLSDEHSRPTEQNEFFSCNSSLHAPWKVRLVDTGEETGTGGRVKRLAPFLGDDTFMLTWTDGLADINLKKLVEFHRLHGRLASVTAVHPPPRYGHFTLEGDRVTTFEEKPPNTDMWINGAFYILEPEAIDYIEEDSTMFENAPMEGLVQDGQLMAYRHEGFWYSLDSPRDRAVLLKHWDSPQCPWKVW